MSTTTKTDVPTTTKTEPTDPLDLIRQRQQEIAAESERQEQDRLERERLLIEAFAPIREFLEPLELLRDDQFVTGENPITNLGQKTMTILRPDGIQLGFYVSNDDGNCQLWDFNPSTGCRKDRYTAESVLKLLTDFFARHLKPL
jgi:hypothetical protein